MQLTRSQEDLITGLRFVNFTMHVCTINLKVALFKGIVSVYIAKFSNGSAWVSYLVKSGSSEYSIATKHTQ